MSAGCLHQNALVCVLVFGADGIDFNVDEFTQRSLCSAFMLDTLIATESGRKRGHGCDGLE